MCDYSILILTCSDHFGLSNFPAWEVAEIVGIAKFKGYVKPMVYQAMYNCIARSIESELVPCLRKNKTRLVVYNPLAGLSLSSGRPLVRSSPLSRTPSKLASWSGSFPTLPRRLTRADGLMAQPPLDNTFVGYIYAMIISLLSTS